MTNDCLVDRKGLLRLRILISAKDITAFDICIQDVDDDDLFPLVLKKHDELLRLLTENGLPAHKAGKETNQEKRASLRHKAQSNSAGLRESWVDARSVEKKLRESLPQLILKVFENLKGLTTTVTSLDANTKVSWRKAVDSIGLSWGDPAGISIPYELRGAGVRRLFMVAYFQYEAATSLHATEGTKYVFAVEEPEVHLHPGAQRDLDIAFRDLADLSHTVVFTTHSPVFASSAPLEDVVLVVRSGAQAEVEQLPVLDAAMIAAELGVEASDGLIGKNHVILVEGPRDVEFYTNVLSALYDAGHTTLDPKAILFLQCGGIGNLRFNVTTRCMDSAGLKWAVVVDSDRTSATSPIGKVAHDLTTSCPTTCATIKVLARSNIENYLDPGATKAETGIDCLVPHYGKLTNLAGVPLNKATLKKIKDAGPRIAKEMGATGIVKDSTDSSGGSEFVAMFKSIKNAFAL